MKQTTRRINRFAFYDSRTIEHQLEDMAAQGWMLEKPGNYTWKYSKTEPKQLRFAVTYFPDASDFDPQPTEGALRKADFCAQDGWIHLTDWGVMQIFYNEDPNPIPIDTDPVAQVASITKAMKRASLPSMTISLAMTIYMLVFQFFQFQNDPLNYLSSPSKLYLLPVWFLCAGLELYELLFCLRWMGKAKSAAQEGRFLLLKSESRLAKAVLGIIILLFLLGTVSNGKNSLFTLVWLGIMALVAFLALQLKNALKKRGVNREWNQLLTIGSVFLLTFLALGVILGLVLSGGIHLSGSRPVGTYEINGWEFDLYDDEIPYELTASTGTWSKQAAFQETFLLSHGKYRQKGTTHDMPDLEYTIVDVRWPKLYDLCKEEFLRVDQDDWELFQINFRPIGENVYQRCFGEDPSDTYVVLYDTRIVELKLPEDSSQAQLDSAIAALQP